MMQPSANGRPRINVLLGLLLLLSSASCGTSSRLSVYLRTNQANVDRPLSVDTRQVRFVIEPGTPARAIGQNLAAAGLIDDPLLFEAYVTVNGLAERLGAGTYLLAPSMTLREVVDVLQNARAASIRITIPEGWRIEQSADSLAANDRFGDAVNGVSAEAARYTQKGLAGDLTGLDPSRYPFLQERPAASSLEGYLFPATYELALANATAEELLARQLDAFAAQVVPLYREAVASGATTLSLHAVLTLASIVEREAVLPAERPAIAGVYLNRLAAGMKLDADPTVQYAMGYQPATGQWWKTPVFLEEYSAVDSPYNTYLQPGLPPGPIAAPGLESVRAVLYPMQHAYLYFVAQPDGSGAHVFAVTFDEHEQNVRTYLGGP